MTDIPDHVLAEAMDAYYSEGQYGREANEESMRAALEAAYPLLPKPRPTAADFLIELRRIADALEAAGGKQRCAAHLGDAACYLADRHVGHHITADGKRYWLDED